VAIADQFASVRHCPTLSTAIPKILRSLIFLPGTHAAFLSLQRLQIHQERDIER